MRKDKISEKMIKAKNEDEDRVYQTQRIFNVIIPPKTIKKLSPIYNDNGRWNDEYIKKFHYYKVFFPYSLYYYTIDKLDKNAVIIPYSGFKNHGVIRLQNMAKNGVNLRLQLTTILMKNH